MIILRVNDRVKFGDRNSKTGTIVGHGTMLTPGGSIVFTYAVRLDEQFQGHISSGHFISTLLVCADGVTKI